MLGAEGGRLADRLHVDDEIDVALGEAQHVLRAMARNRGEAHHFEQALQALGLRRGEFDEFETVGAERIVEQVCAYGIRAHRSCLLAGGS